MIKRRKGFQQKTALKRGKPLARRTAFRSSGPVKPRRAPGPRSAEKYGRDLMAARSEGVCEIQVPGVCLGQAAVFSHRKRRSQSSPAERWSATNGLAGCGSGTTGCEGYLTEHGSDPYVRGNGWTVHPSVNPARVPVYRRRQWVRLSESGDYEPCDLTEIAEWIGGAA